MLHKDEQSPDNYRLFDYERDILGALNWDEFSFINKAQNLLLNDEKLQRTIARIDYKTDENQQQHLELTEPIHEYMLFDPQTGLDIPFLVRQLIEVIPNPWQSVRILDNIS